MEDLPSKKKMRMIHDEDVSNAHAPIVQSNDLESEDLIDYIDYNEPLLSEEYFSENEDMPENGLMTDHILSQIQRAQNMQAFHQQNVAQIPIGEMIILEQPIKINPNSWTVADGRMTCNINLSQQNKAQLKTMLDALDAKARNIFFNRNQSK